MTVNELSAEEKAFLAGSLRAVITADGVIDDDEIAWIDRLRDEDKFDELDQCLDEFAKSIEALGATAGSPPEAYWTLAGRVARKDARELIYSRLRAVARRAGHHSDEEESFLSRLRFAWDLPD